MVLVKVTDMGKMTIYIMYVFHNNNKKIVQFTYWFSARKNVEMLIYRKIKKLNNQATWACLRGVMIKALDCGIEFKLHFHCYVHFRTNTLEGRCEHIYPAS